MNKSRIQSIDYIRGLVMVLMAIDHVRVYSGIPSWSPEPAVFFTRWVTHFCAPAFTFFAGTSAFLYGTNKSKRELINFLVTRGLILMALELTAIRFLWAFSITSEFILAGVIWMLGCCMVLMALLVNLKPRAIGLIGMGIILGQQLFGWVPAILPNALQESIGKIWEFVYPAGYKTFQGVNILYVLVPWLGVMATGYSFGYILQMEWERQKKWCYSIGITMIALFIGIGSVIAFNSDQTELPFLLRLLNQNKYPASILFLMMTLGPTITALPYAERARGWLANIFIVIGRVPFFYYLLHILLIHLSAIMVNYIKFGESHQGSYNTAPYTWLPDEWVWSLPLLYTVFLLDVVVLYFVCKWYASYKLTHQHIKWLKYI